MKSTKTLLIIALLAMITSCGGTKKTSPQIDYTEFENKEYWETVSGRAAKIVTKMELNDTLKSKYVQDLIAAQYYRLNTIHDGDKEKMKDIKSSDISKELKDSQLDAIKAEQEVKIKKLHDAYIHNLSQVISDEEIEHIKDGMTYNVAPNTYNAFLDMIPNLTQAQKDYIWEALAEAREHAMDAGSSKEKHAWFGKYKGRINNYLTAEGYNLKELSLEWEERLKAKGVKL